MSDERRVEVVTTIRAPQEKAFDAWLSPDRMARFLCAFDSHVSDIAVDSRVGGAFRIVMSSARGDFEHRGRYLEIDRPRRLRFTWISPATNGEETEVSVTFEAVGNDTRVSLVHVGLADDEQRSRHKAGWQSILEKLQSS